MANPYSVKIKNIVTDGTNLFVEISIFDGSHTAPSVFPVFPVGTAASTIQAYAQAIADNQPALTQDIANLINTTLTGN